MSSLTETESSKSLTLMVSAGEASGDAHAAHAIEALKELTTCLRCFGMGADALQQQGMELIVDCRDLAVIGITDVLLNYPAFLKRLKRLREVMRAQKPDLLLLVDYADFNLKLAETAREQDIPVLFYISPKVWAWRASRVKRIASLVSHMAVLFPFEVDIYRQAGVPVTYVGNPVVQSAVSQFSPQQACRQFGVDPERAVIALLPGSRHSEIKRHMSLMIQTARQIRVQLPDSQFLVPIAPTLTEQNLRSMHEEPWPDWIKLTTGDSRDVMRCADVVLLASGTATLETALLGTPMVVMYVVAALNYAIMRRLIRINDIALVNIVAGRRIVPEYVQNDAQPEHMAQDVLSLLNDNSRRKQMIDDLHRVSELMGDAEASRRVAQLIISMSGSADHPLPHTTEPGPLRPGE